MIRVDFGPRAADAPDVIASQQCNLMWMQCVFRALIHTMLLDSRAAEGMDATSPD